MKEIKLKYYYCLKCLRYHYSHLLYPSELKERDNFLDHIEFDGDKVNIRIPKSI